MVPVEKRILIKAASMYYLDHMKQSEIAERMGVDRTTVSKYLKKAMNNGIVKIEVESDSYEEIEAALERRFGLREAYVVPKSYDMLAIKQSMAQAGLNLLRRIMADGQIIGMAWGSTIQELTKRAHREKMPQLDIDFVPIDGGPESIDSDHHVNTICYEMAKTVGGRSHFIYAPAITRTSEIRDAILQDANYEKISQLWQRLDIAMSASVRRSSHRTSSGPVTSDATPSTRCGGPEPWGRSARSFTTRTAIPYRPRSQTARSLCRSIPCGICRTASAWLLRAKRCRPSWAHCTGTSSMC